MTTATKSSELSTTRLVESAILIAIGTVLSLFSFSGMWAAGGGVTFCSMLPLVFIAHRHGTRWGLFSAFDYAVLQMLLGLKNVGLGQNFFQMSMIVLLDYILAFTAIGLSAIFNKPVKERSLSIALGIIVSFALRFLCHFVSGWMIWDALWPNDKGLSGAAYSLIYNGGYMLPETLVALVIALLLFVPLKRYWLGEDLTDARAGENA